MLALLLREPFAGVTPRLYWEELSDREIFESYLAPRDDDFQLIPLRRRLLLRAGGQTGSIENAGRELPSLEKLGLDEERLQSLVALNPRVHMSYVLMFFAVWARRGLPREEIEERYRAKVSNGKATTTAAAATATGKPGRAGHPATTAGLAEGKRSAQSAAADPR